LAVLVKTISYLPTPGASARTFETSSQVIELKEGPLADQLFQPPDGYRRVDQLSMAATPETHTWAQYAQYEWGKMQAWVGGLLNTR
jgi:hypothetical protein